MNATTPDRATLPADTGDRNGQWRLAAWVAAALVLLLPLVAMAFTEEVNWSAGDFAFAAALLFGSLGVYEVAVRTNHTAPYRAGVGFALAATALLMWVHGAVGITGGAADVLLVLGVPAVGLIGAAIARFRPRGMAATMSTVALAVVSVGVGALLAGGASAAHSASKTLGITGAVAALFLGAALLFWYAGREAS